MVVTVTKKCDISNSEGNGSDSDRSDSEGNSSDSDREW